MFNRIRVGSLFYWHSENLVGSSDAPSDLLPVIVGYRSYHLVLTVRNDRSDRFPPFTGPPSMIIEFDD